MSLDYKPFEQLDARDIERLIDNEVRENRTIEYKRELPGSTDGEKKEFLADVSAFANTIGGYVLYGVEENDEAIPVSVPGVGEVNVDETLQKLDSLVRDSVRPKLDVRFRCIEIGNSIRVIAARVPRSARAPHMVAHRGSSRFFLRDSIGKSPMDIDQIRAAFLQSEALAERLRSFRSERTEEPISLDSPPPKVYVHFIPQDFISPLNRIALSDVDARDILELAVGWAGPEVHRHNFDGVLVANRQGSKSVQVFRNGVIEFVSHDLTFELSEGIRRVAGRYLKATVLERELVNITRRSLDFLDRLGVGFPIWLALTLVNFQDVHIAQDSHAWGAPDQEFDRDYFPFSELLVEQDTPDIPRFLKPLFDEVWNAAGFERSQNYDAQGNWEPK